MGAFLQEDDSVMKKSVALIFRVIHLPYMFETFFFKEKKK